MPEFLALEWDNNQLCGLDAQVAGRKVHIRKGFVLDWPEGISPWEQPEQAGRWLEAELIKERPGVKGRQVLISLPREAAVVRPLELPDAPANELPDLVRLQAATKSALPLDQLLLDFLPLPVRATAGGRHVLMATLSAQMLDQMQTLTRAAGLQLASIGLSPVATAELIARVERRQGENPDQTSLMIGRHGNRVEISMMRQQHLLFTHSTTLTGDNVQHRNQTILAEIRRSVVALQRMDADIRIARAWVLGAAEEDSQLCEALEKRLDCGVRKTLDPFRVPDVVLDDEEVPGNRGSYAGPVGMVLSQAGQTVETIDFLHPRKPAVKRDRRKLWSSLAAAGVLLAAIAGYGSLQLHLSGLDAEIEAKQKEAQKLDRIVKEGQPDLKSAAAIGEWAGRNVDWLDQMDRLNKVLKLLGGTERVYLTDYRFVPSTRGAIAGIRATGFAREERDVRKLHQQLALQQYRVNPYVSTRSSQDSQYPYRFELDIELVSLPE